MRITEIKISIHRKYTQDFQSFGYRIGIMMDVGLKDEPRDCYYQGKSFLNERIKEENNKIADLLEKMEKYKVKDAKGNIVKLTSIPQPKDSDYKEVKISDKQTIRVSDVVYVQDVDDAYHRIEFETDMKIDDIKKDVNSVRKMGVSEKDALLEVAGHRGINMKFLSEQEVDAKLAYDAELEKKYKV